MLGKVVPQPENQPEYPLKQSSPKSDPVTEGSALQAEPKSDPISGLGGNDLDSIFRLQLGHRNFYVFTLVLSLNLLPVIV